MASQLQLLNKIPDELKPERCEVMEEIKCLENELKALKKEENVVSEKFQRLINRKSDLCDFVLAIRKEEDEAVRFLFYIYILVFYMLFIFYIYNYQ